MENREELERITRVETLSIDAPRASTPIGLKTELLEYQKASVHRILSMEASRRLSPRGYPYKSPPKVESSCCVLAEPFGSGKTIIVLAVLLHRPVLSNREESCNFLLGDLSMRRFYSIKEKFEDLENTKKIYKSEVIKEYKKVIFPSIIIVASSVLGQWKETIERLTNLKYIAVSNVRELRDFHQKFARNPDFVNAYDIILIKNGSISSDPPVSWEDFHGMEKNFLMYSIPRIMSKVLERVACNWLIYDDYDVVASPATRKINSLYTIFVSATQKCMSVNGTLPLKFGTIDLLLQSEYSCFNLGKMFKDSFFNSLVVRSDNDFIESCFSLPKINVFVAKYRSPYEKYSKLLKCFKTDEANGLLEAINGEALKTALGMLDLEGTPSVSSLFKKILYKEWGAYETNCILLEEINEIEKIIHSLPQHPGSPSQSDLAHFKESLRVSAEETQRKNQGETTKSVDIAEVSPQYQSKELFEAIEEIRQEAKTAKIASRRILERVKENLSGGDCPICCSELSAVVITQCCHLVICEDCLMKAFRMHHEAKSRAIIGMCPQCRRQVDLQQNIIYINGEKSIKEFQESTDINIELIPKEHSQVSPEEAPAEGIPEKNPKLKALRNIIKGIPAEGAKGITCAFRDVLFGMKDVPPPEAKKVLVFASFEETLDNLSAFLEEYELNHIKLFGSCDKRNSAIKQFRESKESICMLVNSNTDCSGIHLPETTDIVFFHDIHDQHIQNQIIGRAQRIGREYNLNVWFLLYFSEVI